MSVLSVADSRGELPVDSQGVSGPVAVRTRIRPRRTDPAPMTRYRGGTYSHTVDTVVFTDGTSARTDLIRLNPNIEAYSLDFAGIAPTRPSRYRAATWSAVRNLRARSYEAEVDWIVRNSFPTLGTAELSRRVRAAGVPLGSANLAEHEAIAATQAAIWSFTNGLALDNRPRNEPARARPDADGIVFEFDGAPQLGGYTVELESTAAVSLVLQKSPDGVRWEEVAASGLNVAAGRGTHRRTLGVGSTVSSTRLGHGPQGYRYYRLAVLADRDALVRITDIRFWLNGSGTYANSDRVVHLYNYLTAGARAARRATMTPALSTRDAVVEDGLVGPFRLQATDSAALTVSHGAVVDRAGRELSGPVNPGDEFFLRLHPGTVQLTLTVRVPATPDGFGGRVITAIAQSTGSGTAAGLTPVVLAAPAQLEVEFDIAWDEALARTA
jgi:TQXA domain-containing protein